MEIASFAARKGLRELLAVALVATAAFVLASREIGAVRARGQLPYFYQRLYEPAIRVACGQAFGVDRSRDLSAQMTAFLQVESDSLTCEHVAPAKDPDAHPFTRVWYHLLVATGALWRMTGISWLAMDRAAAAMMSLFAIFVCCLYRCWTPISIAAPLAFLSVWPGLRFASLLRDVSKAPFILGALVVVALLVSRSLTRRALYAAMAGIGLWLGIGYGFRPDVAIVLPLLVVAAIFVRPAPVGGTWRDGAVGAVLMFAVFLLAARPAFQAEGRVEGGCHWHFALLGLSDWHTYMLGLQRGNVSWLTHYNDTLVWRSVTSYAQRNFDLPDVGFCTSSYDRAARSIYFETLRTFPADLMARGLGAVRQILDYGYWGLASTSGDTPPDMSFVRGAWEAAWLIVLLALLAHSVRLGLFAVFALVYLCAYPAVQFEHRHFFHLAFLAWVPVGLILVFLVHHGGAVFAAVRARSAGGWQASLDLPPPAAWRRAIAILAGIVAVVAAVFWGAARHQEGAVATLFAGYLRAPGVTAPVAVTEAVDERIRTTYDGLASAGEQGRAGRALRLEFGGGECVRTRRRPESGGLRSGLHTLTVGVSGSAPGSEFRKDHLIQLAPDGPASILFLPLYDQWLGATHAWVELPVKDAACLGRAEWVDPKALPSLWVSATLHPGA